MISLIDTWKANDCIYSLAISPDGACVGAGCGSTVTLWDVHTGQTTLGPLEGHTSIVLSVTFSPDGRTFATGSQDKTIRIWDTETGKPALEPLTAHTNSVYSVIFSHDGCLLISGSLDNTIRCWYVRTGQSVGETIQGNRPVLSVAISTDGGRIYGASSNGHITAYDAATGSMISEFRGHTDYVRLIGLSPDGRRMVSASDDRTIRIWDSATGHAIGDPLVGHSNQVHSAVFSPDGKYIASGSLDKTVRIGDAETGASWGNPLSSHTGYIRAVAFTPDSTRLISGSHDFTIKIWDVCELSIQTDTLNRHTSMEPPDLEPGSASSTTRDNVVSLLEARGCTNMTDQLDQATCNAYPISSGGLGDTYRCKLKNGTEVAVKTMRLCLRSNERNQEYLEHTAQEMQKWAQCRHPNVLQILGLAMLRDEIGMVTKWQPNGTLPQYLKQHPDADRYTMSIDIAAGLSCLHESGVVHGNLKGENVFISEEGVPQLANFGHTTLQTYALRFTQTSTKGVISSRWAAPELFKDTLCSTGTDVYALGMTILETITGDVPYAGKGEHAVLFAVAVEKTCPERPTAHIPEDSEQGTSLWFLLKWCWEIEPEERPTAADVTNIMRRVKRLGLK